MSGGDKVNILLVDDQPAKLLTYEAVLKELGENLLKANSAQEAFQHLLRADVAVVLVDVYMPDLDGFELARMIREHPRFQQTAIIFISAVLMTDLDFLRGYEAGAVDYVPVPIVPEILRAKVKVFAELYRKSRQLEQLNRELEARVAERTAALEASTIELQESAERLRLAFEAARMGWWDCDLPKGLVSWSANLPGIMGFAPESFGGTIEGLAARVHPEDREKFGQLLRQGTGNAGGAEQGCELRFTRPDGSIRWSLVAGQVIRNAEGRPVRFAGVDLDITERKEAEERRAMLARELDHRAKNMLAVVQSVLHLSKADTIGEFTAAVSGRIQALSRAHMLLSESRWQGVELGRIVNEEIVPFRSPETPPVPGARSQGLQIQAPQIRTEGPAVSLPPSTAQSLAVALHELTTNAAKYGALSRPGGQVALVWELGPRGLELHWSEEGGPAVAPPSRRGFGTRVITASVEHQLGGKARFDWRPQGLRVALVIPLDQIHSPQRPAAPAPPEDDRGKLALMAAAGTQILLVEDEALIGAMFTEVLGELGFQIIGPIADLAQAVAAAQGAEIRGAILDVNLGQERTYPVADVLTARSIPFIFVTGYNPADVDRRFAAIPILEKPIDPATLRQLFAGGRLNVPDADTGGAALAS
jgi:PAS domain S-box-containing protein